MRDLERPERRDGGTAVEADKWSGSRHVVQVRPHVWGWLEPRLGSGPVLEIGPGLRPTAPVASSTFVDASLHALRRLEARGARTAEAASSLPFESRTFGAALAFEVLEHVDADVALLDEIARDIRPGGLLVMSTPVHAAMWSPLDDACGHVRRDEPDVLLEKVRAAGFEVGGFAWAARPPRALTSLRARALRSNRRLSTAFVQRWIFPFHAAYQRWFQRVRWTAPDRPVPSGTDDLMLWARRVDTGRGTAGPRT
jgi:SAM-dependent methyltransferase